MAFPIANVSAVVTGAVQAAMAFTVEMLPTDVTKDAVLEAARSSVAWFLRQLWAWLVAARAGVVDNFPVAAEAARRAAGSVVEASEPWVETATTAARRAAGSAVEASEPWVEMASKLLVGLYGRLVTAYAGSLPDSADAAATGGGRADQHVLLVILFPVVFLCGAVWALTCRTMKGPGLGGACVPRAMFEANPKRYYDTVRTARRARRGASGTGWKLLLAGAVVAYGAYLATTKTLD